MKKRTVFSVSSAVLLLAVGATWALRHNMTVAARGKPSVPSEQAKESGPVLVELFTSEGCSSCPPADQVLSTLVKARNVEGAKVVPLEEHVDYWNHLGWADPYSSAQFSDRQNKYATAFSSNQIYTPQMIVDGQTELVGSDLSKARAAIAEAAGNPKATIEISEAIGQSPTGPVTHRASIGFLVKVSNLPPRRGDDIADVMVALTADRLSSNVASGENGGRRLVHDAVVRKLIAIGTIKPSGEGQYSAATSLKIPAGLERKSLHIVVFVQERSSRRVLGAASIDLAEP